MMIYEYDFIDLEKKNEKKSFFSEKQLLRECFKVALNPRTPEFFITRNKGFVDVSIGKQT